MGKIKTMIQYKSKHAYSNKYNRWYPLLTIRQYVHLDWEDYMYLIGDKVFKEPSKQAEEAFTVAKMWMGLKQK
jgi:hypothetical protein